MYLERTGELADQPGSHMKLELPVRIQARFGMTLLRKCTLCIRKEGGQRDTGRGGVGNTENLPAHCELYYLSAVRRIVSSPEWP